MFPHESPYGHLKLRHGLDHPIDRTREKIRRYDKTYFNHIEEIVRWRHLDYS